MMRILSSKIVYVLVATLALGVFGIVMHTIGRSEGVAAVAKQIVAECSVDEGDHGPCYESAVPALYPGMGMTQLFDVVRKIRTLDPSYQFCHVLAHKLGERAIADDPNNWLAAIPINPTDGLCSNGFIHGVIVGRFDNAVLDDATIDAYTPDFARACEPHDGWQPSALDQAMCYHGMGHLFDFITNAKIPKALELCQTVAKSPTGDFRQVCLEGVFMQFYQPLEPEDYALVDKLPLKLTKNTVRPFCNSFTDPEVRGSCLRESWPLFREDIVSGTGAAAFCAGQPTVAEEEHCYQSASSIVGRLLLGQPDAVSSTCDNFPPKWQSTCYAFGAQAVLEERRSDLSGALAICELGVPVVGTSCIEMLVDHARFIFGADINTKRAFCALVPDYLKKKCNF
jgi:hypothetical protein